jgi:hypothetical protein
MPLRFSNHEPLVQLASTYAFTVEMEGIDELLGHNSATLSSIILQINGYSEQAATVALTEYVGMPQHSQRIQSA